MITDKVIIIEGEQNTLYAYRSFVPISPSSLISFSLMIVERDLVRLLSAVIAACCLDTGSGQHCH